LTKVSQVKAAASAYAKGDYAEALELNRSLGQKIGAQFFSANIRLCEKRLEMRSGKLKSEYISSGYKDAHSNFYRFGNLRDTQSALNSLLTSGQIFDKKQREFKAFVDGLMRLTRGWPVPPRQPNPGLFTREKHILYCLHQSVPYATNGYSTRSHGVAVGLQKLGWKVRATTRPGFPWDAGVTGLNKGYHQTEVDGITYSSITGSNLNATPLDYYLFEAADHYLREAQTSGAEVIAAASNHITALPALMAARRLGLPFVYEVRGLWEVTQASTQPEWAGSERYRLMRTLEQQAAQEADLVITLTEELAEELTGWGVERSRILLVPNAVDVERFTPAVRNEAIAKQLDLAPGVPVIGYAGSAVAYEGLELLLEALAELQRQGEAFVFVLVGDGKVMDTVKSRVCALGLKKHCRFTGRVPFDQVPQYLSCMDIMPVPRLSTSVTEMVSALKPLEAMAMGKAVVLSDVSPHKTMAGSNERARLFRKDDKQDLARTLQELMHNPSECARLGKAARAWTEETRSWNHVTIAYAQALEGARSGARSSGQALIASTKSLDQMTLGLIADQFTTDTLASAIKVIPLSPDNWRQELDGQPIDALFVESAWKGNNGQWHRKVGYYSEGEFAPLDALLSHCREQGIPSLFWNKEDPVHFDRFSKAASLCDHVFTTDSRRIIPYLTTPGAFTKTASSCPFYASPKIHNLLPSTRAWQATAAYGGTYYGERYPERTEYMDKIMSAAAPLGLTIYDRQHADPDSPYKYPSGLCGYVAGGLSYGEMIQAYKAHPVQINVNSVLDSPTMFSRRVVETAACGAPLISGPALGMNRYLEGAAHVIHTESEAAQALENLLLHPAYRWRMAFKGARAVMRAHTTQHRLIQMLRTAGFVMEAPQVPQISVWVERMTAEAARNVLAQTLRPQAVVAAQWSAEVKARLEHAGIACQSSTEAPCPAGSLWFLADTTALEQLEPEDLEDMAWASTYAPQPRIAFKRDSSPADGEWHGVALQSNAIDPGLQLVRAPQGKTPATLVAWAAAQPTLALRKPPKAHEQAPNTPPHKTVLIAGHDLKFIKPFYPYFTRAGIRILLDFWSSHTQQKEAASKRLIGQADTVFCEWMLGNAIWYGKHKQKGQKLVGRLHLQEIEHALFPKIPFEKFETVIFVGPHILRQGIAKNRALKKNGVVVYNGVDVEALQAVPRKPTNGKVLGFVGIVPQRKRFDLALDILRELRQDDNSYILRIKGKRPKDFPWMASRQEELAWYEAQYRRLDDDPLLRDAVFFDGHGNDMPEWYSGIDYVLSTSDFESFHFTVADGAAAGCVPVVLPWEGADEIYKMEWICADANSAAKKIRNNSYGDIKNCDTKNYKFDIKKIAGNIYNLL
jgi:glycosyltransferase involved in cell wall biosynthesis